jgi:DNA integrity scanning protein DisA with diadenylate cyclase activity
MSNTPWIKARRSANAECVEMRRHDGAVQVRDTKARGCGPVLNLTKQQFVTWLAGAKAGEFDHLRG